MEGTPRRAVHFDGIDAMLTVLILIWGSAFVGIKVLATTLDPFQVSWYRYALFPVAYGTWMALRRRDTFRRVSGNDWVAMAVLGFLGVVGYHFSLNYALHGSASQSVTAATGSILVATGPLWTLLVGALTRKEQATALAWLGSVLAFAGVAVVVLFGTGRAELTVAKKALVALLAPIAWSVYSIYTRPLVQRYGGLFTTGATLSLGALTMLPIGLHYGLAPLRALDHAQWAWLAFLAVLSTITGYALWNSALKHRTASQVTTYVYFNPVVTTVVGFLFLREHLTLWFAVGAGLVLAGVIVVNRERVRASSLAAAAAAVAKS